MQLVLIVVFARANVGDHPGHISTVIQVLHEDTIDIDLNTLDDGGEEVVWVGINGVSLELAKQAQIREISKLTP